MIISIKPVDVLFFRDSKPFSRGSEHFAKSLFPPSPQTLYGALRTEALDNLKCDYEKYRESTFVFDNPDLVRQSGGLEKIKEQIGTPEKIGVFSLKGPLLLYQNKNVYLKLPADIKKVENKYKILKPFLWKDYGISTDLTALDYFPHIITDEPLEDETGYIALKSFIQYTFGEEIKEEDIKKEKDIFSYETRIGIGVNDERNAAEEGQLYSVGFVRLHVDWSLIAEVENLPALQDRGIIQLGGERKICEYEILSDNPFKYYFAELNKIKEKIEQTKQFKIIFLTPTYFDKGWISNKFDDGLEMEVENIKIKLISALIGRAEIVSGWDLAKKRAKPLKNLVPAGSVYYFSLQEGDINALFEKFNWTNFSDTEPNLGFGLSLIGGW